MEIDDANRIIAKFMGIGDSNSEGVPIVNKGTYLTEVNYVSLDDLVRVWEKIDDHWLVFKSVRKLSGGYHVELGKERAEGRTIQEAAAIATAQMILNLKEQNDHK